MDLLTVIKRSPIVFPVACAAAVAMVVISEGSYWQSVETLGELTSIQSTRTTIGELQLGIQDAETGQRDYLLTNRIEYLQPYNQALKSIDDSFTKLDAYYGDDPETGRVLKQLHVAARAKVSELTETLRLHGNGQPEAARQLIMGNAGKEQMDAVRSLGTELLAHETTHVDEGRASLYRTLLLSRVGMAALSAISLIALLLYLRQTLALKQYQHDLKGVAQTERERLEREVVERTAQLTELTHHLQTAREDERQRLARNLHDELGALLTSAKLDAARIRSRLAGTAPEALERLAHLVGTLNTSIALGRRIIEDLRPSTLGNLGLVPTLEILMREFTERANVEAHCALEPVRLDAGAELMVYRLVQEAITNITKYAQARHVWVRLAAHEGQVEVSVRDDGIGFTPGVKPASAYGLVGMRFRVEAEGGRLSVVSAPGQGTQLTATLPEKPPSPA
jgi:signal transduction histidine kinase